MGGGLSSPIKTPIQSKAMAQETDWINAKHRLYKELTFETPVTKEEVYSYAESQNFWTYAPQGYGMEIVKQDADGLIWRYYRYRSCD